MDTLLQTASGLLVVLDEQRRIVTVNHTFLKELGICDIQEVLGFRLGESLQCIHAHKDPDGCGTTDYCVSCGANIAIRAALEKDLHKEKTCALISDKDGARSDICLRIKAKPIQLHERKWILVYAQDITEQQYWANLERVFFHDVSNTITALYGSVQLLQQQHPAQRDIDALHDSVERLLGEVAVQKKLALNRQADYRPVKRPIELDSICRQLHTIIDGHRAAFGKEIQEDWPREVQMLKTDPLLISKVLGNMVINALEATPMGCAIRIMVRADADQVAWNVWNQSPIPPSIQKRIFQRYFSQKPGAGRGLGTYSMKLFGETYLKGRVSFTSAPGEGTLFTFSLPR